MKNCIYFRLSEEKVIDLNIIQHITVNPCEDMLVVTTLKSQLYSVKLFEKNIQQV